MNSLVVVSSRGFIALILFLAIGVSLPVSLPGQETAAPAKDREQHLRDLEKQLEALQKQLETLRSTASQSAAPASPAGAIPAEWIKSLKWRSIGPAGMGGRITAISVYEADPSVYFVATASGGLLKTENNGVTFTHQFDQEATVSIGDVCVAPSNKDIVWIGTGEGNPRNSVSYGDGVYKSTDGGKSWTNMGLKKSFQTGRLVVHPTNPDIVYVGALGRLYGPNEERGLYKTTDGGKSWEKVLYIDDKTGVIDIAMHPANPDTLIVSTWERLRDGFDSHRGDPPLEDGYDIYDPIKKWAPGTGIHKTTDGGKTWKKLTAGLPTSHLGRIDIEYYRKDPNTLYALVDCQKIGMGMTPSRVYLGVQGRDADGGARIVRVSPKGPAEKAGLKVDDVIKSVKAAAMKEGEAAEKRPIARYSELTGVLRDRKAGDKLVVEIVREDKTQEIEVTLEDRPLSAALAVQGPAYLGIQGEDAENGARLMQVVEEGPGERAGLRVGDIVKSADKTPVTGYEAFTELLRSRNPGDRVALEVQRDDKTIEIAATLEERPTGGQFGGGRGGSAGGPLGQLLGAAGEDIEGGGVRLVRIFEDRLAQKVGLNEQDVLKQLDGKDIADVDQLVERIGEHKEGDKVTLKIERGEEGKKESKDIAVTLEPPGGARTRPYTYMYSGQQANVQDQQGPDGHEYGGVYKSTDGGESWTRINSLHSRPMYFCKIRVDPSDDKFIYVLGVSLHRSKDGGKTFTADGGRGVHADNHALWIDPRDGRHMVLGTDGGYYVTWDRMANWEHLNHMAIAQFYHVCVDSRQPPWAYGGLQDNGSWGGPLSGLDGGGPLNEDWIGVGGGDGFVCRVDPFDPDIVYFESQNGAMTRRNLLTGERTSIRPRPQSGQRLRFNWNTPYILSNHNPGIFYAAGNYVFRSVKRGEELKTISPEIARTGRGTATALAESPRNPDVLWVGTDDGNLWITRDGGVKWTNVADKVGLPGPRWVATVEPSRFAEGRCYVAFDAHRSDDDEPYLHVTEDFGETWKPIRANLPTGSTRCLREDLKNENLLFAGTEFAVFVSIDRGAHWNKLNNNLPTVAVHELAIHPTTGEMVAGTHGRSLWVLDITPLRQISTDVVKAPAHLFEPNTVVRWRSQPAKGTGGGAQLFRGENPPRGGQVFFSVAKKPESVSLKIVDVTGRTIREFQPKVEPGLNVVAWDLSQAAPRRGGPGARSGGRGGSRRGQGATGRGAGREAAPAGASARRGAREEIQEGDEAREGPPQPGGATAQPAATQPAQAQAQQQPAAAQRTQGARTAQGGGGGGGRRGRSVDAGVYRVVLVVDGQEHSQTIRVENDPTLPNGTTIADDEEEPNPYREGERAALRPFIDD
jgi:S1-C subfamily serine protease/photosystem II stability/assembly factor-like uncharacterized protein